MKSKYSIKDLEKLSGIKAHTLRAWEQRYNLIEPNRTDTNIRYYSDEHLKRILNIAVLVKSGMRISKVADLTDHQLKSAVIDSGQYHGNYESQINSLKVAMLEYDEYMFDSIFNKCLLQFGTDETLNKIVGPFFHQVGVLWQAGAINISNEHFISNLIKQKLFAIIDQTVLPKAGQGVKSYVLYLPGDELHELGLLYLYYYLKREGHRVIYLGQSVPIQYVKEVSEKAHVDQFVSIFTSRPHSDEIGDYFERIGEMFDASNYRFFITGLQVSNYQDSNVPQQVDLAMNLEELKTLIV